MTTESKNPKTVAQVTAQVRESRRQYRQQMLRTLIAGVLPKGDYATFYRDIADCYKRCGLSIPKAFTLFVPDEEMVTKLREVITDKRIFITYSEKLEKGQIKLVPRVR